MNAVVAVLGAVIVVVGGIGLLSPVALVDGVQRVWRSPMGMTLAVGVRVVLGLALLVAAPSTRHPGAIRFLGVITLIAALTIPLVGRRRIDRLIAWWTTQPPALVRVSCALASAFGAFIVYAVS